MVIIERYLNFKNISVAVCVICTLLSCIFFLLKLILCAYVCRMCVGYGCACMCTHKCEWKAGCTLASLWSSEHNLRRQPLPCIPCGVVPSISSPHLPSPCSSAGIINTHTTCRDFCIGSEGSNSANTFPHRAIILPNIILMLFFLIHKHPCYLLSQQWSLISMHVNVFVTFSTFYPFLDLIISFKDDISSTSNILFTIFFSKVAW